MTTSVSAQMVIIRVVARECRTALLTASRTHRLEVLREPGSDGVQRAGHPHGRLHRGVGGQIGDDLMQDGPQLRIVVGSGLQIEDRGPNLLDHLIAPDRRGHRAGPFTVGVCTSPRVLSMASPTAKSRWMT